MCVPGARYDQPMNRTHLAAAALGLILLAGCSSTPEKETTTPAPRPATTTTAASILQTDLATCTRAQPSQTSLIEAALQPGLTLGPAFAETSPNGDIYIGANILRGTERISSADVWAFRNGSPFALSSDARSKSSIADGRKLGLSAGDNTGTKVQGCVVAQTRKDNGK